MSDHLRRSCTRASLADKIGTVVFAGLLFGGTALCLKIVYGALGLLAAVAGAALFPVLVIVTPWYALAALDDPIPLLLCYGAFVSWALIVMPPRAWRFYRDD